MSELRSSGPEPVATGNFYSAKTNLGNKLDGLLMSMDPKTREMIHALAKAPMEVQKAVLAKLDPQTRSTMQLILDNLG